MVGLRACCVLFAILDWILLIIYFLNVTFWPALLCFGLQDATFHGKIGLGQTIYSGLWNFSQAMNSINALLGSLLEPCALWFGRRGTIFYFGNKPCFCRPWRTILSKSSRTRPWHSSMLRTLQEIGEFNAVGDLTCPFFLLWCRIFPCGIRLVGCRRCCPWLSSGSCSRHLPLLMTCLSPWV